MTKFTQEEGSYAQQQDPADPEAGGGDTKISDSDVPAPAQASAPEESAPAAAAARPPPPKDLRMGAADALRMYKSRRSLHHLESLDHIPTHVDGNAAGSGDAHDDEPADEHHGGGDLPFYAPPVQRNRWGEEQFLPHVDWGDIFYDLFFVAAAFRLGSLLKDDAVTGAGFRGIVYYVGIFGHIMQIWHSKNYYDTRISVLDHSHRVYELARTCFLAFAIVHIEDLVRMSDPSSPVTLFFTIGIAGEWTLSGLRYVELGLVGDGDRYSLKFQSAATLIFFQGTLWLSAVAAMIVAAVFYVQERSGGEEVYSPSSRNLAAAEVEAYALDTSQWVRGDIPIIIVTLGYIANLIVFWVQIVFFFPSTDGEHKPKFVPMHIEHCMHRYGEWSLLMLGESVLSLLVVDVKETGDYYAVLAFGIISVMLIQFLHFQSQPSDHGANAFARSINSGLNYYYSVMLESFGLVAMGASYKIMLYSVELANKKDDASYEYEYAESAVEGEKASYEDYDSSSNRLLGPAGGVNYYAEDDVKRYTAGLFCVSLFIVLFSLDLHNYLHRGFKDWWARYGASPTLIVLLLANIPMYAAILTLWLWLIEPEQIAGAGLVIVAFKVGVSLASTRLIKSTDDKVLN